MVFSSAGWRFLGVVLALEATALTVAGCARDGAAPGPGSMGASVADSSATRDRIEELRARFLFRPVIVARPDVNRGPIAPSPVLGADVASAFEPRDGYVHALLPAEATQGAPRTATVALPVRASDPVRLEDDTSHVAVSFALRGASAAPLTTAGGIAMYAGALAGADVLHRVHAEGTEDYLVFEERPAKEEIAYDVDVSRVAGLRLVSNTLEFLDEGGAPRLRVAPPYVVDANGGRAEGVLALEGCASDASPRAPWGRAVTSPGASRCGVRVSWQAAAYPAMVDPSWTATGSMASARYYHTATLLGSGELLVAGGDSRSGTLSSAELYNPTAGTFAVTGSMTTSRLEHTATLLGSGTVLITGGAGNVTLSSAELYNPTKGTFTASGSMTTFRQAHTATLLASGKVLVAGGTSEQTEANLSTAELYNPTAGTFAATGSMTSVRAFHTATLLTSGEVLMAGGAGNAGTTASAELYNPNAGTFAATGSLATARDYHTATLLASGAVLVAGGQAGTGAPLSLAELYNPTAGTFAATGSLATARYFHTATLLGSGQVLVAGGETGQGRTQSIVSSAELYTPTAGTFAVTGSLASARYSHTATLLGSGEVLATGGNQGANVVLSSAELFSNCQTACPAGDNCGTVSDGCGGTLSCGTCASPQTCGGGGTANVCGCTPITTCPAGATCGTIPDGCGGTVTCSGPCPTEPDALATCNEGTCSYVCDNSFANCTNNIAAIGCNIVTLTDVHNCGACGNVCSGTCTNGACATTTTLATGGTPECLAVDETDVYWTDISDGTVLKAPIGGGATTTLAVGVSPFGIAIDATTVYWTDSGWTDSMTGATGTVLSIPKGGAPSPTPLAASAGGSPTFIAVDSSNVYWTDSAGYVESVPLTGGASPTTLATSVSTGGSPVGIAVDATHVYWTDYALNTVNSVPIGGGAAKVLAGDPTGGTPSALTVNATSLYWVDDTLNLVMSVPLGGATTPATLASGLAVPVGIAVDSTSVYIADNGAGVSSVPLQGGPVTELAAGLPNSVVVDATSVYWTDATSVMKRTPK